MSMAARIGDMHTCPMQTPGTPVVPHVGGPITAGCPSVIIGGQPAARVGDTAVCVGPPDTIVQGEASVLIGNMPAARMGDATAHGGVVSIGCPTVIIGAPVASAGSAAAVALDKALGGSSQQRTLARARRLGTPFAKARCNLKR